VSQSLCPTTEKVTQGEERMREKRGLRLIPLPLPLLPPHHFLHVAPPRAISAISWCPAASLSLICLQLFFFFFSFSFSFTPFSSPIVYMFISFLTKNIPRINPSPPNKTAAHTHTKKKRSPPSFLIPISFFLLFTFVADPHSTL